MFFVVFSSILLIFVPPTFNFTWPKSTWRQLLVVKPGFTCLSPCGQGSTIAIDFAKIIVYFLNLLNSIVIEPRLVLKCKKSEGRYWHWYWTSRCLIIGLRTEIALMSLWILQPKLRLKCNFSSTRVATEIEKPFYIELQPPLKLKIVISITETGIDIENLFDHLLKPILKLNSIPKVLNMWLLLQ